MIDNKDLLGLAYKACYPKENYIRTVNDCGYDYWNPLYKDDQAQQLITRLKISVVYGENSNGPYVVASHGDFSCTTVLNDASTNDIAYATKWVIVNVASEIGRRQ